MSTVSTQLVVSATDLTEYLYKRWFRKNASERELMGVIRLSIIVVIGIAVMIELNPESSILDLVAYAWASFGTAFGPAVLFSLYCTGTTRNGILAGIIVGGLTVIFWSILTSNGIIPLYEIVPGFIFFTIAIIIFSKIGSRPTKEMNEEFELVQKSAI